jgi:hypothetical protein
MDHLDREKWCRVPEARTYLKGMVCEQTIRRWVAMRWVDTLRLGGTVLIPTASLDKMVRTTPAIERPE